MDGSGSHESTLNTPHGEVWRREIEDCFVEVDSTVPYPELVIEAPFDKFISIAMGSDDAVALGEALIAAGNGNRQWQEDIQKEEEGW